MFFKLGAWVTFEARSALYSSIWLTCFGFDLDFALVAVFFFLMIAIKVLAN